MKTGLLTGPFATTLKTGALHSALKCSRLRGVSQDDQEPSVVLQWDSRYDEGPPDWNANAWQTKRVGYYMAAVYFETFSHYTPYYPFTLDPVPGTPENEWGQRGKLVVVHGSGPPGPWTPGGWGILNAAGVQSIATILPWGGAGVSGFSGEDGHRWSDYWRSQVWGPTWGTLLQFDPILDSLIFGGDPSSIPPTDCASFEEITIGANEFHVVTPAAGASGVDYEYSVAVFYPERHPSDLGLS